jgi:hypothetical protein
MRAEKRRAAAKKASHRNARRTTDGSRMGAGMGKVCERSRKKPMAQWRWEIQDGGSRTKLGRREFPIETGCVPI